MKKITKKSMVLHKTNAPEMLQSYTKPSIWVPCSVAKDDSFLTILWMVFSITGLTAESDCSACDPGYYCPGYGNTAATLNCSAGYYCSSGSSMAQPTDGVTGDVCPVGSYCPTGSGSPIPCAPGTYTDTTLNAECLTCTAGHYCIMGTNPEDCPAGWYCPAGTGHVWQPCPIGTYSAALGLSNETQCTSCSGGFYCESTNATAVTGPCDQGYYCTTGAESATPSGLTAATAGPCPMGHYCPQQTVTPEPCPAGENGTSSGGYCQTSNIRCTWVGNNIADHSDVVGAAPTGDAPTTSEWSAILLPTQVCLHLNSWLNTWLQWIGQRQQQDETRII